MTPESEIIADREFYARLREEHHARMEEALAHIDDQDLVAKMRAVMNESSEPMPLTLYPTSREYSAIFDVPDDVKPDWLEAIRAAINLVLSSAHTTRKPVDWFNPDKEVEKATEALGILNSRFNTGGTQ